MLADLRDRASAGSRARRRRGRRAPPRLPPAARRRCRCCPSRRRSGRTARRAGPERRVMGNRAAQSDFEIVGMRPERPAGRQPSAREFERLVRRLGLAEMVPEQDAAGQIRAGHARGSSRRTRTADAESSGAVRCTAGPPRCARSSTLHPYAGWRPEISGYSDRQFVHQLHRPLDESPSRLDAPAGFRCQPRPRAAARRPASERHAADRPSRGRRSIRLPSSRRIFAGTGSVRAR